MDLLLDTHVLLWNILGDSRLKPTIRALVADGHRRAFFSLASLWEIGIKLSQGKLRLPNSNLDSVLANMQEWDVAVLPITLHHTRSAATLPFHHGDPFDRMLIAQVNVERLQLVSADEKFRLYDVDVTW